MSSSKIGFTSVYFLGITAVIGSGIFLLPATGYQLLQANSIFAGVLALLIALCFANCASRYDQTGGPFLYAKDAFGDFIGFEVGFVTWAVRIIAEGTLYVGLATAVGAIFPQFSSMLARDLLITALALALMTLNLFGVSITAIFNNIITIAKIIPLLFVAMVGFFAVNSHHLTQISLTKLTSGNFASATLTFFFVFVGFEGVVVAAGEMNDAKKIVPKALLWSMISVTVIYLLILCACIGVLGAKTANSTAPLQATLSAVIGPVGAAIVAGGTIISMLGSAVASTFITPRSGVALAEKQMLPASIKKTNRYNAPYVAIIISTVLGLALAYSGSYATLAQISAISRFAQYLPTIGAIFVFAKYNKLPFPFARTIACVALGVSLWLLANTTVVNLVWGLGALVVAVPFYVGLVVIPKRKQLSDPE